MIEKICTNATIKFNILIIKINNYSMIIYKNKI